MMGLTTKFQIRWPSILLLGLAQAVYAQSNSSFDPLQFVDQLIGAANGGNVFAGATLPYGMAKTVADVDSESNQGGFSLDGGHVTGFSTVHDSGTGGNPSLGDFPLFPYASCAGDDIDRCVYPKPSRALNYVTSSVNASPGFFEITLVNGMTAAMTAAQHTGLFRFSFAPSGDGAHPLILLDLTDLSNSRQDNATVSVDPDTGRMTGSGRFLPSFGTSNYVLYFCADFSGSEIFDNGIWVNSRANTTVKDLTINRGINSVPLPGGAFVRFQPPSNGQLLARMGVSYISSAQACSNAENEIPDFNFEDVQNNAVTAWREKLSPIKVSTAGVDSSFVTNFYSGVYRTMVNPQNYTNENPLWQSSEPYFDSFYCLWDSFRSQIPFLTLIDPTSVAEMIRSLIDTYVHLGWLPDCRMSLCMGFTQGGSNADNVLGDALIKNITSGINWDTGYDAVVKDAEVEPFFWSVEGRGGLDSWKSLGYIPVEDYDHKGFGTMTRSISRTLEYSYNDFVIAQMASVLGDRGADVQKYLERSENWKNLFKADQKSFFNGTGPDTGFVGFFQPKYLNDTFGFQDPLKCSNIDTNASSICSLQNNAAETFESSIWEYSFFVPHDQASLITLFGGYDAFVNRLNFLHDQNITYIGNEPAFLTVFQYHYAGRPGLSASRSHFYIPRFFSPTPAGLPGNDDSGAMGSFVAFSMMGLFPNPGQNVYLITPPFFESIEVTSPVTGKTATVRNVGFDPTYKAIFIQRATLDGVDYTKNWIDHSFFLEGKELVLYLGLNESTWGTRVEDLPPTLGEYPPMTGNSTRRFKPRGMWGANNL